MHFLFWQKVLAVGSLFSGCWGAILNNDIRGATAISYIKCAKVSMSIYSSYGTYGVHILCNIKKTTLNLYYFYAKVSEHIFMITGKPYGIKGRCMCGLTYISVKIFFFFCCYAIVVVTVAYGFSILYIPHDVM